MGRLRTTLKWGSLSIVILLLVLVAAWAVSRAMYPTEAQREAIAEMEQLPEYTGKNAFALLWTLDHDVPEDELEAVMAEDVQRFLEKPAIPNPDDDSPWGIESAAEEYPDLSPGAEDRNLFCNAREKDCLARVHAELDAYNALIDRNQALLNRVESLKDYEYVHSEFPYRIGTPLPAYQSASLLRTRHAVQFANGQEREAIAAICRDILTWRRLSAHSDTLITRLMGVATSSRDNGHMLANMLARLPVDMPLPEPCDEALAPPTLVDVSICNAMRGEFGLSAHAAREMQATSDEASFLGRFLSSLLFDVEATVGMSAEAFRSTCSEAEAEKLRTDQRITAESAHKGMWRFACVGNFAGCITNSLAWPAYIDYHHRLQDHGTRLRVLGTLAWMRRHAGDGRSPSELLAARPDAFKSPARDIEFGPEGRTLRVPLYATARNEYWSIPLPSALHKATDS